MLRSGEREALAGKWQQQLAGPPDFEVLNCTQLVAGRALPWTLLTQSNFSGSTCHVRLALTRANAGLASRQLSHQGDQRKFIMFFPEEPASARLGLYDR